jgi:hypothetical protein
MEHAIAISQSDGCCCGSDGRSAVGLDTIVASAETECDPCCPWAAWRAGAASGRDVAPTAHPTTLPTSEALRNRRLRSAAAKRRFTRLKVAGGRVCRELLSLCPVDADCRTAGKAPALGAAITGHAPAPDSVRRSYEERRPNGSAIPHSHWHQDPRVLPPRHVVRMGYLGLLLLATGLIGYCPLYALLG